MATALTRTDEIKRGLVSVQKQLQSLLQDKRKSDRFMATALAVASDRNLSACTPESIIGCCVAAAQLDLNIDKNLGQVYIVPYKGAAQLQIGARGYNVLLDRAGWKAKVFPVYSTDEFSYEFNGWDEIIKYEPDYDARETESPKWVISNLDKVFTAIKSPNGEIFYNVMSVGEIEKIRQKSPNQSAQPSSIWFDWYEEMAIKTALKRHIKRLPIGDSVQTVVAIDEATEKGKAVDVRKSVEEGAVIEAELTTDPAYDVDLNVMVMTKQGADQESETT
ncbi:MAG: recombinase RecT [Epsilonproteobacteria bacterium]|nr:recombinase RecT [Campylobacterota bacterium]